MPFDPIKLRVLAEKKEEENWDFRQFLKQQDLLEDAELDERVFALTKEVWAGIDCTTCANCCKQMRPTFSEEEVARLAKRLGIEGEQLIESYLEKAEQGSENPWHTRSAPCPFLKDDKCSVYEDRPANCRGYPYLYEPGFSSRTWGMIERTFTCPIVFEVMERLKHYLGYPPRRRRRR